MEQYTDNIILTYNCTSQSWSEKDIWLLNVNKTTKKRPYDYTEQFYYKLLFYLNMVNCFWRSGIAYSLFK